MTTADCVPTVSVIIPTYNMAKYVTEAIDSVLAQTVGDIEVVVVDDGSRDNTADVMASYASDRRVRYIRKPNGGEASARNRGLREARGPLIAFLDADDVWFPTKLERQIALLDNWDEPAVVYTARNWIDEHGNVRATPYAPFVRVRGHAPYRQLLMANCVPMSTPLFTRALYKRNGDFDETLPSAPDWDYWLRASVFSRFDYVDEPLASHRLWSGQITANKLAVPLAAMKIQEKFLRQHGNLLSRRDVFRAWSRRYERRGRAYAMSGQKLAGLRDLAWAIWMWPANTSAAKYLALALAGRL